MDGNLNLWVFYCELEARGINMSRALDDALRKVGTPEALSLMGDSARGEGIEKAIRYLASVNALMLEAPVV